VGNHWPGRQKSSFRLAASTRFLAELAGPVLDHWTNRKTNKPFLYRELRHILGGKLDELGRATPESMYMVYKSQEWANKKAPSRLLTVMVHRALARTAPGQSKAITDPKPSPTT
jgi:hypothetical protein